MPGRELMIDQWFAGNYVMWRVGNQVRTELFQGARQLPVTEPVLFKRAGDACSVDCRLGEGSFLRYLRDGRQQQSRKELMSKEPADRRALCYASYRRFSCCC